MRRRIPDWLKEAGLIIALVSTPEGIASIFIKIPPSPLFGVTYLLSAIAICWLTYKLNKAKK